MNTPSLFDNLHPAETAFYASVAGHKTWHEAAEQAMKHLASQPDRFSADDLRDLLVDAGEPPTPNAYGGLFLSWSKQGLIRRAGYTPSRGVKNNHREQKLWIGVQHMQEAA